MPEAPGGGPAGDLAERQFDPEGTPGNLLMATRNPAFAPVEGKVVDIPLFTRFHTSQVVVGDF